MPTSGRVRDRAGPDRVLQPVETGRSMTGLSIPAISGCRWTIRALSTFSECSETQYSQVSTVVAQRR